MATVSHRNGVPKLAGLDVAYASRLAQPRPNRTLPRVSVFVMERSGTPRLGRHSEERELQKKVMKSSLKGTTRLKPKPRGLGLRTTCRTGLTQPGTQEAPSPGSATPAQTHRCEQARPRVVTLRREHDAVGSVHRDARVRAGHGVARGGNTTLGAEEPRGGTAGLFGSPVFCKTDADNDFTCPKQKGLGGICSQEQGSHPGGEQRHSEPLRSSGSFLARVWSGDPGDWSS